MPNSIDPRMKRLKTLRLVCDVALAALVVAVVEEEERRNPGSVIVAVVGPGSGLAGAVPHVEEPFAMLGHFKSGKA